MSDALMEAARAVAANAHAPYSGYHVGAAVMGDDGRIYVACNVENASYGLSVCAETHAVGAAVAGGAKRITAVAVFGHLAAGGGPTALPCGRCRQVLAEFASADTPVEVMGPYGAITRYTLGDLLPHSFAL